MLQKDKTYYTYKDLTIVPTCISVVEHRAECSPYDSDEMLPLFTAPMDTVVNKDNFDLFESDGIHAILPRTESIDDRLNFSKEGRWAAYSLGEFEDFFSVENGLFANSSHIKALIDIANGHMLKSFDLVRKSKEVYGDKISIMVGNIANPTTYEEYAKVGADYIRLGIGAGRGCLTTSNLGVHMPMASLVDETVSVKHTLEENGYDKLPKIIADGGIRNYSDIIKALALGADYVMVGGLFSRMLESAAPKLCDSHDWHSNVPLHVTLSDLENIHKNGSSWIGFYRGNKINLGELKINFYGMASKDGQIAMSGKKSKTSEGRSEIMYVAYTMKGWVENMTDYLRSAMSYVGAHTLDEFKENTKLIINSENSVEVVNK